MAMLGRAFLVTTLVSVVFSLSFLGYTLWLNRKCDSELETMHEMLKNTNRSWVEDHREVYEIERLMFESDEGMQRWIRAKEASKRCRSQTAAWSVKMSIETCLIIGFAATVCVWLVLGVLWLLQHCQKRRNLYEIEDLENLERRYRKRIAEIDERYGHSFVRTQSAPSGLDTMAKDHPVITYRHPEIQVESPKAPNNDPGVTGCPKSIGIETSDSCISDSCGSSVRSSSDPCSTDASTTQLTKS